jgi:hypothetical protein
MRASGYTINDSDDRLSPIAEKLGFLEKTGRFGRLLTGLFAANDKANLHSLLLEVAFAHHFEVVGKTMRYEVRQVSDELSTIDFHRYVADDLSLYFELRLVQQQAAISDLFEEQLSQSAYFGACFDGEDERRDVIRLQRLILSKVQDKHGTPMKFFSSARGDYNIVVVEVSELLLGMLDKHDAVLAMYGEGAVDWFARRRVFGLFQEPHPDGPPEFQEVADQFRHFRETVHGVLFVRRCPKTNHVNFELEHFLVTNARLVSTEETARISEEIKSALLLWRDNPKRAE